MEHPRDFALFPQLPVDIRLVVWESLLSPRIFSLQPERYENPVDTTAISPYVIAGYPPRDEDASRSKWTGRFVLSHVPSHAIFQVSRESRHFAFSLGYRTWTVQKRRGVERNMIWHPSIDIILFPQSPLHLVPPGIPSFNWLRMFAAQYPKEVGIAEKIALHTSIWPKDHRLKIWIGGQLFKFRSLRHLVMVIDDDYERDLVLELTKTPRPWGPWKIPDSIVEVLQDCMLRWPQRLMYSPNVKVVGGVDMILRKSHLEATLRCSSCHYFDPEQDSTAVEHWLR